MSQHAKSDAGEGEGGALAGASALLAGLWNPSGFLPELGDFGIRGPWSALRTARNFVVTTWDPSKSDIRQGINVLIDGALRDPKPEMLEEARRRSPDTAALWDERYDPPLDLGKLERLPEGTLGCEYARFVRDNHIEPLGSLVEWGEPENLLQYTVLRAYKLHDVLHVILGCPATPLGEVEIVSFSVGQGDAESKTIHAPALALAVLFLHLAIRRPHELVEATRLAAEWTRTGQRARPYTGFRLEEMMDRPVGEVREQVLSLVAAA